MVIKSYWDNSEGQTERNQKLSMELQVKVSIQEVKSSNMEDLDWGSYMFKPGSN